MLKQKIANNIVDYITWSCEMTARFSKILLYLVDYLTEEDVVVEDEIERRNEKDNILEIVKK
jgi:hypothetical protein